MKDTGTHSEKFPRSVRLQKRWEFEQLKAKGKRVVVQSLIGNWMERQEGNLARVGLITSKKLGNAVVRSRARRVLREVFRRNQHLVKPADIVLIPRNSLLEKSAGEVEKNFLELLRRADLLKR